MTNAMISEPDIVPPIQNRHRVIQRLLDAGVSAETLTTMLPEFRPVIEQLASEGNGSSPRLAAVS